MLKSGSFLKLMGVGTVTIKTSIFFKFLISSKIFFLLRFFICEKDNSPVISILFFKSLIFCLSLSNP